MVAPANQGRNQIDPIYIPIPSKAMNNYYIHNLETRKIELHFEKSAYMALSSEQKANIKKVFLWAKSAGAWVSRSTNNHYWAIKTAKELELEYAGEEGERLTFAEQQERKQERAEVRAERYENRAARLQQLGDQCSRKSREMAACIPFGQPIMIGHV